MKRHNILEIKVGAFVLLGLALLVYVVFSIGDIFRAQSGYSLNIHFRSIGGIDIGSPVRLAGVGAGEVKKIEIFYNPTERISMVKLDVWVKNGTVIKEGYKAYIRTLGLLGEKYLEIMPVTGSDGGRALLPGEILRGEDPVALEEAMESVSGLLKDKDVKETLKQTLANSATLLERLNKMASNENIDNVNNILANLKEGTDDLDVTVKSLNNILGKIERAEGDVGKFVNQSNIYDDLSALAADLRMHPWKLLQRSGGAAKTDARMRGTVVTPGRPEREKDSGHGIP